MPAQVALLMGSKNDLPKLQPVQETLARFGVELTTRVMSAHRTPEAVAQFAGEAAANGYKVILAAAGGAAHLAGAVAAHTTLPVIGIPVEGGALNGLDALLSTVQMPGGIAVAAVGIGSGGAMNAALLAVQILALQDAELARRLREFRAEQREQVAKADAEVAALEEFRKR
ncbi:MAG: 5-(carboxyamino)imidazole ribonucleotide mutase [Lentisphaeria bacterium]